MSRTILITGAAKRVGRAIALGLVQAGDQVAVHYRTSAAEAAAVVDELQAAGAESASFGADLTVAAEVEALAAGVNDRFGRLDVVVAAAAVFRRTPWTAVSEDDWDFHVDANLKATFLLARAVAPRMNEGGVIVTFGDWAGERAYTDYLPYCVSKAGVIALSKALAQELAPRVRVNCVCPGTILPPPDAPGAGLKRLAEMTPLKRLGSPDDAVAAVKFFVEGSDFTTGSVLHIDGGRAIVNNLRA
ncbi:MAG: SDR family oxidoreductase [Lentisphaeria bacterium]|jgi:NAD(P)-dependent dehydrogenase (short-subunit alcohol dehydrogenase family)|nr:SDR family oxidoreductase [Lentisphaeria bacterium]